MNTIRTGGAKSVLFIYSAGIILLLTGLAKIITAFDPIRILYLYDPITGIPFRQLFLAVGVVEVAIAFLCFVNRDQKLTVVILAWLSAVFLTYRFGLFLVGWHKPCPCLGTMTDALHISTAVADTIMKCILGYLMVGSCIVGYGLWRGSRLSGQKAASLG